MISTMYWVSDSEQKYHHPAIAVEHFEHATKTPKRITFRDAAGSEIHLHTDEDGLKKILDALADHPEQIRRAVRQKANAAIEEAKRLGAWQEFPKEAAEHTP